MTDSERTQADTASIDAIIHALYDGISGRPGERDWARQRALFLSGARLIPTGPRPNGEDGLRVMDHEEYLANVRPYLLDQAFYEVEIARRTERFGPVAHVFSTYESRRTPEGAPFMRGINSIQLLWRDGRWWVVTVFWANEGPELPIPARYLRGD